MDPFLISLGLQGISAVGSWWSAQDQAKQLRAESAETVRRFDTQAAQQVAQATGAGAASGVELESRSLRNYIGAMEAEYRRQSELLRGAGERQAKSLTQAGNFTALGDFGSALLSYGRSAGWGKG